MSCCKFGEFLHSLKSFKEIRSNSEQRIDLQNASYVLKNEVIHLFPINQVPKIIVDYLSLLEERINIADEQLTLTIDRIILEIENGGRA